MKKLDRIMVMAGCVLLLAVSWIVVLNSKSGSQKQMELIEQSKVYLEDKVYIRTIPLLEEAASYEGKHRLEAEELLKEVYLKMPSNQGYDYKYTNLLEKQMSRKEVDPKVFVEAANFYLEQRDFSQVLKVLRKGMEVSEDESIRNLYEENRYRYDIGSDTYDEVTEIFNDMIGVRIKDKWGLASSGGNLLIPCEYDKITTYSAEKVIVKKQGEIYSVDLNNNRLALLKEKVSDFGNYSNGYLSLKTKQGWQRANGEFFMDPSEFFEEIGTYYDGYVPARQGGKWGLLDQSAKWQIAPEYDAIIMDGLGCAYRQGALFAKKGNKIFLVADGQIVGDAFEDAKPFNEEGYAAVKKNGKWGFIGTDGELKIKYQFDEALSFGQHLAAVKKDDLWGYISQEGKMAIEPSFFEAKTFSNGKAPVLTTSGWQFIQLLEYKRGGIF